MSTEQQHAGSGGLWERIRRVSAEALGAGALVSIATEREVLVDGEVAFQVRVAANLRRKDAARRAALDSAFEPGARRRRENPFLPYDEALYVANVGPDHVALLNKFNVMDHHLLVVTRAFAEQRELITRADFAALWRCLQQVDGLGFYNGGEEAGASQPHKHLQLVGLPLSPSGPRIPMEPALMRADPGDGITTSPVLTFPHGISRLEGEAFAPEAPVEPAARELHRRYRALLTHVGLDVASEQQHQPGPYNLLVTQRWMLLVPRTREHFDGVSLNGLAFAGSLFVRDRQQLHRLREAGPLAALAAVTTAPPAP